MTLTCFMASRFFITSCSVACLTGAGALREMSAGNACVEQKSRRTSVSPAQVLEWAAAVRPLRSAAALAFAWAWSMG